jgi:uncharacterized protein (DUF58 family)
MKGEEGNLTLAVPGLGDPWARLWVDSLKVNGPVTTRVKSVGRGAAEFLVRPSLAGRFDGGEVSVRVGDTLGLYYRSRRVALRGLRIDSLPSSLVRPVRRAFIPPLVVGGRPAGVSGKGKEFYGIKEYTERSESKDILWNRAAKDPEKPLLARIREANSPELVTVEIMHWEISPESRPWMMDLQCEALGGLMRTLVLAKVRVEIIAPDGHTLAADGEEEGVEAIMRVSATRTEEGGRRPAPRGSSLLMLVGTVDDDVLTGVQTAPSIFIGGKVPPSDRYAVTFSGTEDLSGILGVVLSR